jgi:hypothetical protein
VCRRHKRGNIPSFIKNLTIDCEDALRVARFWAAALVTDVDEQSTSERAYVEAPGWGGPNIWFRGGRGPNSAPNWEQLHHRLLDWLGDDGQVDWSRAAIDSVSVRARRGGARRRIPGRPSQPDQADVIAWCQPVPSRGWRTITGVSVDRRPA